MSDKKLLKNCPFCGGEAILNVIPPHKHKIVVFPDYEGGAFIECTKCTCAMSGDTAEEAIEKWNTRVPMESIVKELELKQEESCKLYAIAFDPEDRGSYDAYSNAIDIVKEEGGLND